jgi:histidinol-phosphate aminotransferase
MSAMPEARDDIVSLKSYRAGAQVDETIRLNANEAPAGRAGESLNRYPEVRPRVLQARLADLFGVPTSNLLVTRGSSEAIDAMIRAWCRAYASSMITTPPTFDMYRVYAEIQGVELIDVPLSADEFGVDADAVIGSCAADTRLVFLCSPNNPTGTVVPEADILAIAEALDGRAVVVVDEAYIEFADRDSLAAAAVGRDNVIVLRTLSKAHALAGARCGAAIGAEPLMDVMSKVLPPYSFPTPVVETVMDALTDERVRQSREAVAAIVAERERLRAALASIECVREAWPSQANFVLTRFHDLPKVVEYLFECRILIRDFGDAPLLANCARITVGTAAENDALLAALRSIRSDD